MPISTALSTLICSQLCFRNRVWRSRACWPRSSGCKVGDFVEIDLLEGARRTVSLPVTALVEDYFGIRGMMDAEALAATDARSSGR